jgi:hypothetical protein
MTSFEHVGCINVRWNCHDPGGYRPLDHDIYIHIGYNHIQDQIHIVWRNKFMIGWVLHQDLLPKLILAWSHDSNRDICVSSTKLCATWLICKRKYCVCVVCTI